MDNSNIEKKLESLKSGEIKPTENVDYFLSKINEKNKEYNIFLEVATNYAKSRAEELNKKLESGEKLGKLFGLVIGVKSNISVKDLNISCSSKVLENYKGSFNAQVIEKILLEDGIIIGILNNDEFACGSSGESSYFGKTINPTSPLRIPGGSSSGSAAAIAANFCDISLGSDTGGSIRNPASHCGVNGIKPSYGRVSRYGLIDLAMSFDQIGPFSNDIYGLALMMEVISGKSLNDGVSLDLKVDEYSKEMPNKKYNIGVIKSFDKFIIDTEIRDVLNKRIDQLKKDGHNIVEIDINNIDLAIQAYYPIVYTEFFSGTRKFDGLKYGTKIEDDCGEEVLRRILGGMEISKSEFEGAYYKKALKVKEIIANEFTRVFSEVDFIISPVTPMIPHKFEDKLTAQQMYSYDAFTIPANLAGICAGVISKDFIEKEDEKISIGIQLMADSGKESLLFQGLNLINKLD